MKSRTGTTTLIRNHVVITARSNTDSITWRDVWNCTFKIDRDIINISDPIEKALADET
jgi:hypothetical protein